MAVGDRLAGPGPAGAASGPLGAARGTPRQQPPMRPLHAGAARPAKAALAPQSAHDPCDFRYAAYGVVANEY